MPGEVFYWVLNMSIIATVTGFIVMLLGKIKKIPHRLTLFLWIIPFFRFWLPFGIGSQYSLLNFISQYATKTVTIYHVEKMPITTTNSLMFAERYFPITYKIPLLENLFGIAATVWMTIAAALLLAFAIIYATTLREMRNATHIKDNIFVSDKVLSPGIYGIFRPKIILSVNINSDDIAYILDHENSHINNGDNFFRVLAFITAAIHWYNPYIWIFLKQFLAKIELACDEKVILKYTEDDKKHYAAALINCAEAQSFFISAFGGAKIKVRINSILSYKKLSWFSALVCNAFVAAIVYVLLTNAV